MTALGLDEIEGGEIETKSERKKSFLKMLDLHHVVDLMNELMEIEDV
jgi:hypothetical protein